jgi:hypothetical protein
VDKRSDTCGDRVSNIKKEWQKQWRKALGEPTDSMPDYLLNMLNQMNRDIEVVLTQHGNDKAIALNSEMADTLKRSIYRGNEALRRDVFIQADTPLIHLDDEL